MSGLDRRADCIRSRTFRSSGCSVARFTNFSLRFDNSRRRLRVVALIRPRAEDSCPFDGAREEVKPAGRYPLCPARRGRGEVEIKPGNNGPAHPLLWAASTLSGPGR
jgi:hypothetical protein